MNKSVLYFAVALAVAIGAGTLISNFVHTPVAPPIVTLAPTPQLPTPTPQWVPDPSTYVPPSTPAPKTPAPSNAVAPAPQPQITLQPRPQQAAPQEIGPVDESTARLALAQVGIDPQAEAVWTQAINDPSLPDNARKNLIEDLNETGFADPRNLTANDLPVIENRIAIIEQLGPDAIDDTNYAAFQEAYKDLLNMRARLTNN